MNARRSPAASRQEPVLDLDAIQGNIVPGFRKDHQRFLFFTFGDIAGARAFLRELAPRVSSAAEVRRQHALWKRELARLGHEPGDLGYLFLNLALTAPALRALTSPADVSAFDDVAFQVGLAKRSGFIKDPETPGAEGHASSWLFGQSARPVDLLVILARDDKQALDADAHALVEAASARGLALVHRDEGSVDAAPKPGHEHFGFRDGVSEVAIRGRASDDPKSFVSPRLWPKDQRFADLRLDFAAPGKPLAWPGHFLFGYPRQVRDDPRRGDRANTPRGPAWAKDGSFLVYRRLRQHVAMFWDFVREQSAELVKEHGAAAPDPERLAAMLVGRWRSGTPLARSPERDLLLEGPALAYFGFASEAPPLPEMTAPPAPGDPDGVRTPLGAHIRKMNPRDEATDLGIAERTIPKLLLRRGITYATSAEPSADRGILFLAYQSSLVDQFEFLMRTWIHAPQALNAPRAQAGPDPILAGGAGHSVSLWIGGQKVAVPIRGGWVTASGGAYLFAPSLRCIRKTLAGR